MDMFEQGSSDWAWARCVRFAMCCKVSDKKLDFQMIDFNYVLLSLSHPYLKTYNLQNEGLDYTGNKVWRLENSRKVTQGWQCV
jgi:hypothetical protein